MVPLALATGAGAYGRISLGLSVLSGIIGSTCLAVLFVPSFFAVLQGLEAQLPPLAPPSENAVSLPAFRCQYWGSS